MQLAERLGAADLDSLDPDGEAYATWTDALAAHSRASRRFNRA